MSFMSSMNVSASGMSAQQLRMDLISQNIANAFAVTTFRLAALFIRLAGLIAPNGPKRFETRDAILARTFISA